MVKRSNFPGKRAKHPQRISVGKVEEEGGSQAGSPQFAGPEGTLGTVTGGKNGVGGREQEG